MKYSLVCGNMFKGVLKGYEGKPLASLDYFIEGGQTSHTYVYIYIFF
jgi:hypothetical protein